MMAMISPALEAYSGQCFFAQTTRAVHLSRQQPLQFTPSPASGMLRLLQQLMLVPVVGTST